jgi:hypothetical protein
MVEEIEKLVKPLNAGMGRKKYSYDRETITLVSDTGTGVVFETEQEMVAWLKEQARNVEQWDEVR